MAGAKGKKRKRTLKRTDKKQSEGFIRGARELGVDESGKDFNRALDALVRRKPR